MCDQKITCDRLENNLEKFEYILACLQWIEWTHFDFLGDGFEYLQDERWPKRVWISGWVPFFPYKKSMYAISSNPHTEKNRRKILSFLWTQ